jgi:hypothetical protein
MIKDKQDQPESSTSGSQEVTKVADMTAVWPAIRQIDQDKMDKTNLFPFEKL